MSASRSLLLGLGSAHAHAMGVLTRADRAVGAFLGAALSPDERDGLTVRVYDRSPFYRETGLDVWEREWLRVELPPKGRVLIGACGSGREAIALRELGYDVEGFDASPRMVERARRAGLRVMERSFAQVAASGVVGDYDAVLIGSGALSHVIGAEDRLAVLRALGEGSRGPVLASFWTQDAWRSAPSRSVEVAARIGGVVGRLRGLPDRGEGPIWDGATGFLEPIDPEELRTVAARIGRVASFTLEPGLPRVAMRLS